MNLSVSFFLVLLMIGWTTDPSSKVKRAELGREFTLKVGEQVSIREAGLKISFSLVKEDSRCPKGVNCIWAGNGKILLKVSKGKGKAATVELNTGIEPRQHRFQDYDIKLVSLDPYPEQNVNIERSRYVATLLVNK
ncbi:MAG: hypothetical protein ICV68_05205 [Pyrinomonadaceae bacterium]|nr:hypothetical protein [Pyrinomonadaceae bacterium]